MVLYLLDDVIAVAELETNRAFVPSSTCKAFNLDLHTGLLCLHT